MRRWYASYAEPTNSLKALYRVEWVRFTTKFAGMDIGRIPPVYLIQGVVAQKRMKVGK